MKQQYSSRNDHVDEEDSQQEDDEEWTGIGDERHAEIETKTQPITSNTLSTSKTAENLATSDKSLRDLASVAYSQSSLHTYRSRPRRPTKHKHGARTHDGKGQPDMKLRMNFLLEKIKREYQGA